MNKIAILKDISPVIGTLTKSLLVIGTGLALLEAGRVQAAAVTVDTFSQAGSTASVGFQQVQVGSGVNVRFLQNPSSPPSFDTVIGGYRDLFLTNVRGTSRTRAVSAAVDDEQQNLVYSNDSGVSSRLEVTWDGNDNSSNVATKGLGGKDLIMGNNDALGILFQTADLSLAATVKIWDMNNNLSQASFTFDTAITSPTTVNFAYNSTAFDLITGSKVLFDGKADFTNVGAIQLILTGNPTTKPALDAEIDIVQSQDIVPPPPTEIPEPTSILALVGFGLFSYFRILRCHRQ